MTSPILHLVLDNQKLSITGYVPNHHKCNTCIEILLHISTDIFTQSLNDELNHTQRCKKYETNNAKQPTIIQYLYSAIMSYADTEALVAPV